MLTLQEAQKIVSEELANSNFSDNDSLIILNHLTIEKPYAWIFSYTSKKWQETKDDKFLIAGNSPIIVDKRTGKQTTYSSAYNIDEIIEQYEEQKNIWNLVLIENNHIDNTKLLLLKNKLGFSNDKLIKLKKDNTIPLDKGSQLRLASLQAYLLKIKIETKLICSQKDI